MYEETLSWTSISGLGLLGYGDTAPQPGMTCLVATDVDGVRYIEPARFTRKGLIGRFTFSDGTHCYPWEVDGWMDAKPIIDFIRGPVPGSKVIPFTCA